MRGMVLLLLAILAIAAVDGCYDLVCPKYWIKLPNKNKCFRVFQKDRTWQDGRKLCQAEGGDLLTIRDRTNLNFITDYIRTEVRRDVWIGANDRVRQKKFVWLDETAKIGVSNWHPHEPSNGHGEDCVYIRAHFQRYQWNDNPCHIRRHFACELIMNSDSDESEDEMTFDIPSQPNDNTYDQEESVAASARLTERVRSAAGGAARRRLIANYL